MCSEDITSYLVKEVTSFLYKATCTTCWWNLELLQNYDIKLNYACVWFNTFQLHFDALVCNVFGMDLVWSVSIKIMANNAYINSPLCVGISGLTKKPGWRVAAAYRKCGLISWTQQRMIKANTPWRCLMGVRRTNELLTCPDKVSEFILKALYHFLVAEDIRVDVFLCFSFRNSLCWCPAGVPEVEVSAAVDDGSSMALLLH